MLRFSPFSLILLGVLEAHAEVSEPQEPPVESAPVSATGTAEAPSEAELARKNEASFRFQKGFDFYKEGEHKLALVEFEKAYELVPDYRVLYNLALVAIQVGQFARARVALETYLREGGETISAERREDIERDLEMLKGRTAVLRFATTPPDATVTLDDVPVEDGAFSDGLVLDVGQHVLGVRKEGYEPKVERVTLAGGEALTLEVALKPAPPEVIKAREPSPPSVQTQQGPSTAAWVSWGVTAALATGAIVTGIYGISQSNSLDTLKQSPDPDPDHLDQFSSSASSAFIATDVLMVGSVLALGTSVYLTFWAPREEKKTSRSGALRLAVTGNGIRAFGEF